MKLYILFILLLSNVFAANETDTYDTKQGKLKITMIGWAGVQFEFKENVIYVDPSDLKDSKVKIDYDTLPKADYIFITHSHFDHLNIDVIKKLIKKGTNIIVNDESSKILGNSLPDVNLIVVQNNKSYNNKGLKFSTIPAYNITKDGDKIYHPKGVGNGFLFNFGKLNVFVAGDTEDIPEFKNLKNVDIAFLPLNRPYTMDEIMFVKAVSVIKPKTLYPYHYSEEYLSKVLQLLNHKTTLEIKIRQVR